MCRFFRLKAEIDPDFRSAAKAEDCSPVKSVQESVLIVLVLFITAANIDKVLQLFGPRGILAGVLFVGLGFG